jgi:hypothetical protein
MMKELMIKNEIWNGFVRKHSSLIIILFLIH